MPFKKRRIPASILKVKIKLANRSEGEYRTECVLIMGGWDKEFEMWRRITFLSNCSAGKGEKVVKEWRHKYKFLLSANSGESIPGLMDDTDKNQNKVPEK